MEKFLYQRLSTKEPKINVWWAYPAIESFAMASLGYLTIFQMLDLDKDLYLERIYSFRLNTTHNNVILSYLIFIQNKNSIKMEL